MRLVWSPRAWEEYQHWRETDPAVAGKITALLRDVAREPFRGLGKPEPLKGDFQGWWSRRITAEHRLVYRVAGSGPERRIEIAQCRHHYRR